MAYTNPTTMVAGQVFTASRWNTQVKDNFDMLVSLANDGTLKWDNTTKALGVGTTSPGMEVHAYSAATGTHGVRAETTNAAGYSAFSLITNTRSYNIASGGSGTGTNAGAWYVEDVTAGFAARLFISSGGAVRIGKTSGLTGAGDVDANGSIKAASFQTSAGIPWTFGAFTFSAVTAVGYATVTINGTNYKLMVAS